MIDGATIKYIKKNFYNNCLLKKLRKLFSKSNSLNRIVKEYQYCFVSHAERSLVFRFLRPAH